MKRIVSLLFILLISGCQSTAPVVSVDESEPPPVASTDENGPTAVASANEDKPLEFVPLDANEPPMGVSHGSCP